VSLSVQQSSLTYGLVKQQWMFVDPVPSLPHTVQLGSQASLSFSYLANRWRRGEKEFFIHWKRDTLSAEPAIINQAVHTLNHSFIHLSNSSIAEIGPWPPPFFRFLNFTELDTHGRTPLDESSPRHRGLYLHRTTQHINTRDKHPCHERDSNPRSQQPGGRRPTP
jgi:hypothetical protein